MNKTLLAGAWSVPLALAGAFWALGGPGVPLGRDDERGRNMGSVFATADPRVVGVTLAVIGLAGVATALAMRSRPRSTALPMAAMLLSLTLIVVVPDTRVLQNFGYLFMGFTGFWDKELALMLYSILGGVLWAMAAWSARGHAARPPRWGRWVTYAAAVLALPYGISRVAWAMGIPLGTTAGPLTDGSAAAAVEGAGRYSELVLGGLCFVGAVLTLGLVQRWGEVFPRWIPLLRGRRVPILLAVIPGALGAIMLIQPSVRLWIWWATGQVRMTADNWGSSVLGCSGCRGAWRWPPPPTPITRVAGLTWILARA